MYEPCVQYFLKNHIAFERDCEVYIPGWGTRHYHFWLPRLRTIVILMDCYHTRIDVVAVRYAMRSRWKVIIVDGEVHHLQQGLERRTRLYMSNPELQTIVWHRLIRMRYRN